MTTMLKKAGLGVVLAATAFAATGPAEAQYYNGHDNHHRHGDGTGTAVVAGIAGLAIGAAIASNAGHHRGYRDRFYYDRGYNNGGYYYRNYNNNYYNNYDRSYYNNYYRDRAYYPRQRYYDYDRDDYRQRCYTERRYDPYYDRTVKIKVCR